MRARCNLLTNYKYNCEHGLTELPGVGEGKGLVEAGEEVVSEVHVHQVSVEEREVCGGLLDIAWHHAHLLHSLQQLHL